MFLYLEDYDKAYEVFNEALVLKEKFLEEETDPDEKYYLEIDIAMLESNLGLVYKIANNFKKQLTLLIKLYLFMTSLV